MHTNVGLEKDSVNENVKRLSVLLGDIHQLYIKTLAYHWNVEDSRFLLLHELFEGLYKELASDLDLVAERIRMLGRKSPSTVKKLTELKRLDDTEEVDSGDSMIRQLAKDYEILISHLRDDACSADAKQDLGTADMLTQLIRQYEKNAWFLRSHLTDK